MNLAVNARDAMPDGGRIMIRTTAMYLDESYVSRHAEARTGLYTVLVISATGHGMDQDTMSRIFEPFFTTKDPGRGTGLGVQHPLAS